MGWAGAKIGLYNALFAGTLDRLVFRLLKLRNKLCLFPLGRGWGRGGQAMFSTVPGSLTSRVSVETA